MKAFKLIFIISFVIFNTQFTNAQIAINADGSTPDESAMLDVSSSNKGILVPRMDSTSRNNISSPAAGLMVYDSSTTSFWYYDNATWNEIGSGAFVSENGIIHTINDDNNFIVGGDSLNYGGSGQEFKMFFDKNHAAFRTGRVNNTNWDEETLGLYSFATGNNTLATGNNSVAFGYQSLASGTHSFAGGNQSEATAHISLAFGREVFAPSYGEVAFGLYNTAYTQNDSLGYDANDRLFSIGNGQSNTERSDALIIYKNGNTLLKGQTLITDTLATTTDAAPETSAILDVASTDKGILIPRMDSTARNSIASPAQGLMVYDTSTVTFWYYDNNQWNEIRNGSDQLSLADVTENLDLPIDYSCMQIVGSLTPGGTVDDLTVSGNYVYLTRKVSSSGTIDIIFSVIDVSNPSTPTEITTLSGNIGNTDSKISASGDYVYVTSDNKQVAIDVSNPSSPSKVKTINGYFSIDPYGFEIAGNYAYRIENNGELSISDITNPSSMTLLSQSNIDVYFPDIAISGNYAYITSWYDSELAVVDVSNPSAPLEDTTLSVGSTPSGIAISGNYAYVVGRGSDDLEVIDISNPASLSIVASLDDFLELPVDIKISGNYAYIIDEDHDDLKVIDISVPTAPVFIKSISMGGNPETLEVSGNYAHVIVGNNLKVVQLTCDMNIGYNPTSGAFTVDTESLANHVANTNIQLNDQYLSNDGDDEGISIDDDGNVTFSNNIILNDKYLSNDGDDEGISIDDDGKVTFSNNIILNDKYLSNDGGDEGISIDNDGNATLSSKLEVTDTTTLSNVLIVNDDARIDGTLVTTGNITISDNEQQAKLVSYESSNYIQLDVRGSGHSSDAIFIGGISTTTNEVIMMGSVGIGTDISSGASYKLEVAGSAAKSSGSMWTTTSDRRLKSNIETYTEGTSEIMKIKPVTFQYNQRSGYDTSVTHVGVVAQELMEVAPYMVDTFSIKGDSTTYYTVNASAMTYMLINTVQEQQSTIEQQNQKIENQQSEIKDLKVLKTENSDLKQRLTQLEQQVNKINLLEAKLEALLQNQ